MPVRIYDIAKKLGLESKEILVKAKEMGIAAAKVPSSSLDKISAEWLEEEIVKANPALAAKFAPKVAEEPPKPAPIEEKIVIISAPPPPPPPLPAPVVVEAPPLPPMSAEIPQPIVPATPPAPAAPPKPVVPPPPPKPQMGDKVGFIQLGSSHSPLSPQMMS